MRYTVGNFRIALRRLLGGTLTLYGFQIMPVTFGSSPKIVGLLADTLYVRLPFLS